MTVALSNAQKAYELGEVPVGAVLVHEGEVIGEGFNQPITLSDPSAHAEICALRDAGNRVGNYRFPDSTLYVTIEPCSMCVGAMVHARIGRLVFGAVEPKAGAVVSQLSTLNHPSYNHKIDYDFGVLADECASLMSGFFKERRAAKKKEKKEQNNPDRSLTRKG